MTQTEYVNYHQLSYCFTESKRTLLGSFVLSSAVLYILTTLTASINTSLFWFLGMTLVSFARYMLGRNFYTTKPYTQEALSTFTKHNIYLLFISSVIWAIAYATIIIKGNAIYDLIALMIFLGFAGSSILSAAPKFRFYLSLNLISGMVVFSLFIAQEHTLNPIESILSILAVIFIFLSAYHFSKHIQNSLINAYQMKNSKKDIIEVLGRAGEYRDEETGNHILRMSYNCYLLAKEHGFSEPQARELQQASTLHDVGKIGIPDNILLKPGKLNEEEFSIMQSHTIIGNKILSATNSTITDLAKTICMTHHEKWDGTGYPNGLKGKDIPLEGRITAICDVFDALTSSRPYKEAWSTEKAVDFIKTNAGKHFDPKLVKQFLNVLPAVLEYQQNQSDHF